MCGGGLTWKYVPTPQPGDAVKAQICSKCGKRAKRSAFVITHKTRYRPTCRVRRDDDGALKIHKSDISTSCRQYKRHITACCAQNHQEVIGYVERHIWSYHKNGAIKDFFLIVWVPELKRRHWATLETCKKINPLEALADVAEG